MSVVIDVKNIGKRYRVGPYEGRGLLRDKIVEAARNPLRTLRRRPKETFWAVKDISFEVHEGEVLGLIGRNGAGKSTLLKILSRIAKPTTGTAEIHGRVGSLLEVGTGFHPELSGRENVFLNGAILGMGKGEIARKFDEIVAFAEIEKFIDTPVKHYSSGMFVRLAFAVAAHLEPEILFVDEVLSVGDINFQKKCLGKMGDVAGHGRTIVFVSHQMAQIRRLCRRTLWVEKGELKMDGSAQEIVSAYEGAMARGSQVRNRISDTRFVSWEIVNPTTGNPHMLNHLGPVTIRFFAEIERSIRKPMQGIALYNREQQLMWSKAPEPCVLDSGRYCFEHTFAMLPLRPGLYTWRVALVEDGVVVDDWYSEPDMIVSTENYQTPYDEWIGILNIPSNFAIRTDACPMFDSLDNESGDATRMTGSLNT